jgi:Na+/phosphate symporter
MKNELIRKLHNMSHDIERILKLVKEAFIHNNTSILDEAEKRSKEVHKREKELTAELAKISKDAEIKIYLPIPGHLERVGDFIEGIISCIRTKEKEALLFSDKAIIEINNLINDTRKLLNNISDLILSKNVTLAKEIKEEVLDITDKANNFATEHEDRLIEGICQPKSSSVFLSILDSIKGIALHSQRISERIL